MSELQPRLFAAENSGDLVAKEEILKLFVEPQPARIVLCTIWPEVGELSINGIAKITDIEATSPSDGFKIGKKANQDRLVTGDLRGRDR